MTRRVSDDRSGEVFEFVRKQVAAGHQAYVVYPVIEEGGENDLKPAIKMYDEIRKRILPGLRIGLLHGRMAADDKETVMQKFKRGEIDVLVSTTTVIEVGVDVPNATVMVVEHAERFGLSQLHQLRGRIGRGAAKSYCILMTSGKVSEVGDQRLDTMVRTQDGFEIAEMDLQLRGPGGILRHATGGHAKLPGGEPAARSRHTGSCKERSCVDAERREGSPRQ